MSDDIRDKLRKKLGGSTAGKIGGPTARRITSGRGDRKLIGGSVDSGFKENLEKKAQEREEKGKYAPVTVYLAMDATGSMRPYINAVMRASTSIGNYLLNEDKGFSVGVIGVSDHCDARDLRAGIRLGRLLGDYGQIMDPTTSSSELRQHIGGLVATYGGDMPEAYECFAADMTDIITQSGKDNPDRKHVVAFFGDAIPHGTGIRGDDGCPFQRSPQEFLGMVEVADHSYFVGCGRDKRTFEEGTFGIVKHTQRATYVDFNEAKEILPEAIAGMAELARSSESFEEFKEKIADPTKAAGVSRLLLGYDK